MHMRGWKMAKLRSEVLAEDRAKVRRQIENILDNDVPALVAVIPINHKHGCVRDMIWMQIRKTLWARGLHDAQNNFRIISECGEWYVSYKREV